MLHWIIALDRRRRRKAAVGAAAALALLGYAAADTDRLSLYTSERALVERQGARGMVVVGRFGAMRWPALVVDRSDGEREVTFIAPNGQRHSYGGFQGRMKALELRSGAGREARFIVVLADRPQRRDPLR
jgi:hypothetical protein